MRPEVIIILLIFCVGIFYWSQLGSSCSGLDWSRNEKWRGREYTGSVSSLLSNWTLDRTGLDWLESSLLKFPVLRPAVTGLECRGSVETIVNNWCDGALLHSSLVLPARGWSNPGGREGRGRLCQLLGYIMVQYCSQMIHNTPTSLSLLWYPLISTDNTVKLSTSCCSQRNVDCWYQLAGRTVMSSGSSERLRGK